MEREYSVNFGQYNTWSDWHLTPAERPIVVPPTEKTHNIDLPGGSGVIDAAQAWRICLFSAIDHNRR